MIVRVTIKISGGMQLSTFTQVLYLSTNLFVVLALYCYGIFILFIFILLLNHISGEHIVLFTPLHLFDICGYYLLY